MPNIMPKIMKSESTIIVTNISKCYLNSVNKIIT